MYHVPGAARHVPCARRSASCTMCPAQAEAIKGHQRPSEAII